MFRLWECSDLVLPCGALAQIDADIKLGVKQ